MGCGVVSNFVEGSLGAGDKWAQVLGSWKTRSFLMKLSTGPIHKYSLNTSALSEKRFF